MGASDLQLEYLRCRNHGHRHGQALTQVARRYGLTEADVARCLERAEKTEAIGYFRMRTRTAGMR